MKYLVTFSNRMSNDSYISNLKSETVFQFIFGGYFHSAKP
jgi:hypothetical protein